MGSSKKLNYKAFNYKLLSLKMVRFDKKLWNVLTNVGKKFLRLLDKHFSPNHKFYPILNRNCVKISYSCMNNMASIIKSHNAKLMKPGSDNPIPHTSEATCNCLNQDHCPLNGNCTKSCIVYQATITSG